MEKVDGGYTATLPWTCAIHPAVRLLRETCGPCLQRLRRYCRSRTARTSIHNCPNLLAPAQVMGAWRQEPEMMNVVIASPVAYTRPPLFAFCLSGWVW